MVDDEIQQKAKKSPYKHAIAAYGSAMVEIP